MEPKVQVIPFGDKSSWIIGTPPAVPSDSAGSSKSLQIAYTDTHRVESFHRHTGEIEECYIVLKGSIRLKVKDSIHTLTEMTMIRVPPKMCHKIIEFSEDAAYLTIRAPLSDESSKYDCPE